MQHVEFQALKLAIDAAIADPSTANLLQLLHQFDLEIPTYPQHVQLQIAGDILVQLAELIELRANEFLNHWEDQHNPYLEEPVLTAELLQDVLRQTMKLNLDDILATFEPIEREPNQSIVEMVEKQALIEFIEQLNATETKHSALAIAHDEDISTWVTMIRHWMTQQTTAISIVDLQSSLRMPFVEIWLALLLGGFELTQQGNFYETATVIITPM